MDGTLPFDSRMRLHRSAELAARIEGHSWPAGLDLCWKSVQTVLKTEFSSSSGDSVFPSQMMTCK